MAKKRPAIVAKNLHKSFGKLKVLKGVNLQVERGTITAVLGPNGAGKTTMIRILATLLRADDGSAKIDGFDVRSDANRVRELIGLTGQYAAVDEYLTGRENLHMIGRLYHLSKHDTKSRTEQLLKQFDLVDAADRNAKTYSGGMRRRLDLAMSLIATPPIIFLDEPTTGLDPRSRLALWDIIEELAAKGTTILLTTQHLDEADRLADRVAVIDRGVVIAEGTPDELKDRIGHERVNLTFDNEKELARASKLLEAQDIQVDEKARKLSYANDQGIAGLRQVLGKCDKAGIHIAGLSLTKSSLDDVFMKLTGHKAVAEEENEATKKNGAKK